MFIVAIQGGLGNQLFQYAFGRTLELKHKQIVKYDLGFFRGQDKRTFGLFNFTCKFKIATEKEVNESQGILPKYSLRKIFGRSEYLRDSNICYEKNLCFNIEYINNPTKLYYHGFWQSEKYFGQYSNILRDEIKVLSAVSGNNKRLVDALKQQRNTVSLHIRRGDFLSIEVINQIHGTLDWNYYNSALDYLEKKLGVLNIYVFSDDISWVRMNFRTSHNVVFVYWNDDLHNYEDLRLMSMCEHNIIANSTFSWWGAWLNQNLKKIVIAPKRWFSDSLMNEEAKDIIPEAWIKV